MIGTISGTIRHKESNMLLVDVNGVGYKVFVTAETGLELKTGSHTLLWTHLAVRENSLDLFGFEDKETLDIFELLIGISGIGPKTALGILTVASPAILRKAVANEDTSYLTKVSGIGKKNAEKIVLELRGKLLVGSDDKSDDMRSEGDVMEALVSLGYNERDVRDVLKKMPKDLAKTQDKVKYALKSLSDAR